MAEQGLNVANLVATLKLDLSQFQTAVQQLDQSLGKIQGQMRQAGETTGGLDTRLSTAEKAVQAMGLQSTVLANVLGFLLHPLTLVGAGFLAVEESARHAIGALTDNAREVQRMMAVSGLSADAADNLADTFKVLGFNSEAVTTAMFRMGAEIESGGAGLGRLGITLRTSTGQLKTEGDLFLEVRDRISELGSASQRNAALIDIFGRSGRELAPIFAMSREEFIRWRETAAGLSPYTQEMHDQAVALIRAENQLQEAIHGLWEEIGTGLIGPATAFTNWLTSIVQKLKEWNEETRRAFQNQGSLQQPGVMMPALAPTPGAPATEAATAGGPPGGGALGPSSLEFYRADFQAMLATLAAKFAAQQTAFQKLDALRQVDLAAGRIAQDELLRTQIASLDEQLRAAEQYFGQRRALAVQQFGTENAAAKVALAEISAAQTQAIGQFQIAIIRLQAELAKMQAQLDFQLRTAGGGRLALAEALGAGEETPTERAERIRFQELLQAQEDEALGTARSVFNQITQAAEDFAASIGTPLQEPLRQLDIGLLRVKGDIGILGPEFNATAARIRLTEEAMRQLVVLGEEGTVAFGLLRIELERLREVQTIRELVSDVFGALNRAVSTSITGIIQGTTTLSQAFDKMGQSIVLSLTEVIIKRGFLQLENAFFQMLEDMAQTAQRSGLWGAIIGAIGSLVTGVGGASSGGGAEQLSGPPAGQRGAIVTRPTLALIGEAGPEALVPLDQTPGASPLSAMGGGVDIFILDQRATGDIEHKETTGSDGRRKAEIIIRDAVRKQLSVGEYDQLFGQLFGLSRQGAAR